MIIICKHTKLHPIRKTGSTILSTALGLEENYINLTKGKKYKTFTEFYDHDIMVDIIDDSGERGWYPKDNFLSLESYRDVKLKELGI